MKRTIKLEEGLSFIQNGAVISQKEGAGGLPITRIETLSNNQFNRDRLGYADIEDATEFESYILDDGDLLMSHINSRTFLGRTVIYHKQGEEQIIHGMNLLRIKTNEEVLDQIFAYYLFQTAYFKKKIDCIRKDAINQSSISISNIKDLSIEIPDIATQKAIASTLRKFDKMIELNRQINDNLLTPGHSLAMATTRLAA